mmetsp:Transcript_4708/g.13960  ORF Transcript_4708/g.13960 Transcript_4708/m.13960 type:complete len:301 (-) Transcript_4708:69-971(-)
MCDAISIDSSEIWQMGAEEPSIEVQLNVIHRRILGAEAKTATCGVRRELGVTSQRLRANAAALKFRNNILSLPDNHVVKRVYVGLRDDRGRLGAGTYRNGARWLERLAVAANWGSAILGRAAAKEKAKKYVAAEQAREFAADSVGKSTLVDYIEWTRGDGSGLPAYLERICPSGLRHGRRLKTKLRLGAHQLQGSLARMIPRRDRTPADSCCKCCSAGVAETVSHALFECRCHAGIRSEFLGRVREVLPAFRHAPRDARLRFLMSDETPKEIDNLFYRFLIQLFASRERRLASGLAGGRL